MQQTNFTDILFAADKAASCVLRQVETTAIASGSIDCQKDDLGDGTGKRLH